MQDESNPNAAGKADDDSLSEEGLIALFDSEPEEEPETQEEETDDTEETEETEEESPEETETEEEEEAPDAVEGINLDELTDEQWEVVRTKLKSRAAADIQTLKRENAAKDKLIESLRSQTPADPLASKSKVTDPRILAVKGFDELKEKKEEAEGVEEWAQNILDENGGADADDVVATLESGKELTKRQLLVIRNNARKTLKNEIPAKLEELQQIAHYEATAKHVEENILPVQIPALKDKDSAVSATRNQLMGTPVLVEAMAQFPALRAIAVALTAHAANSLEITKGAKPKAKEAVTTTTGAKVKAKPPTSPSGVAAAAPKTGDPKAKVKEAKVKRFYDSGDPEDLIAAMAES